MAKVPGVIDESVDRLQPPFKKKARLTVNVIGRVELNSRLETFKKIVNKLLPNAHVLVPFIVAAFRVQIVLDVTRCLEPCLPNSQEEAGGVNISPMTRNDPTDLCPQFIKWKGNCYFLVGRTDAIFPWCTLLSVHSR